MTVVDMRNFFKDCEVELIEIGEDFIYYAEEKDEEGHHSLFFLEYNSKTQQERIVANYILNDQKFQLHYFCYEDDIIVLMEKGKSSAWVLRIDKNTGHEKNFEQINFIGNFYQCKALSKSYLLIHTVENMNHQKMFDEYHGLTGLKKIAYIYDMDEKTYHYVKDSRMCDTDMTSIIPYRSHGEDKLLIEYTHGDEREKEHCFANKEWLGHNICDIIWSCDLEDLLYAVRCEKKIMMDELLYADSDGMIRYEGMDDTYLYFRMKRFQQGDQRICTIHKNTYHKDVVAMLNLTEDEAPAEFWVDTQNVRCFKVTHNRDEIHLAGIVNTKVDASYAREQGDFVTCIDDRFIVERYGVALEDEIAAFTAIYDVRTKKRKSYESKCTVKGDIVVLH